RLAYRQLRLVGRRTQTFVGEKMQEMSRLQNQVDDIVFRQGTSDPAVRSQLNEISASYQKLKAQVDHSKSRWNIHKAQWKTGDAAKIVAQLDKNMGALFNYTKRMPKDPVDYACKSQRQIVGPMKVSASIPSKAFIKTKTNFSIRISGGDSPYYISWEASNGKTVDQTLTSSGRKSCWFRFKQPGDHTVNLSVTDSCAEAQVIMCKSNLKVLDYHVSLEIPKEPVSAKAKFTAQVKITGGTPPFSVSGNLTGTLQNRIAQISQTAPDTPGQYSFGVSVTDAEGLTLKTSKVLQVNESLNANFTLQYTSRKPEVEFPAYVTIKGGTPPFTLTGALSGEMSERFGEFVMKAPLEPGDYVFTLKVTDSDKNTVTKQQDFEVKGGFTAVLTPPKEATAPGKKASLNLKVYGGTPPYTLSMLASGEMKGASTNITLTAPELIGPWPCVVMVTDKTGQFIMASCDLDIQEEFSITVKRPGKAVAPNTQIPMEVVITGGTPPFMLRGDFTGEVSQRNIKFNNKAWSKPGSYLSYVTCTDKNKRLARHSFTVVVGNAPQVTLTPTKKTATSKESVSVTYSIKNGTPPFVFSGHANGTTSKRQGTFKVTMPSSGTGLQVKTTIKDKESITAAATTWIGISAETLLTSNSANNDVVPVREYYDQSKRKIKSVYYKNRRSGEKQGISKTFFKSGTLQGQCEYKDDDYCGVRTLYHENGIRCFEEDHSSGSEKEYYPSGQVKVARQYVEGKLHGLVKLWYANGSLEMEGKYENGKPVGKYKSWNEEGEELPLKTFWGSAHVRASSRQQFPSDWGDWPPNLP
ncbi:MAG: toxin-antitoxin system YwqK family antitoxin, partial [Phycisphaeraceae bacterium]|nr:toxin-antitoxin system YwqK family antitoxin [Phycisphaeraceae bacterium]